jgi:hypothetical protein
MLNMVSGLARTLYILLAIIAGFLALNMMNVPLVLVVLGLIAGITLPRDRQVLATVTMIGLPILGAALSSIPAIGAQLGAVMSNLQMGIAGALTTALAIRLYGLVMEGIPGVGGGSTAAAATA